MNMMRSLRAVLLMSVCAAGLNGRAAHADILAADFFFGAIHRLDEATGLLVEPGNEQALGQALSRLLGDPQLRVRLGEAGRRRVAEEFSVAQMVEKTVALYRSLVPAH